MSQSKKHTSISRGSKVVLSSILGVILSAAIVFGLRQLEFPVLEPAGQVADEQRDLILFTVVLSLVVIMPVMLLLAGIAYKFRATNTKARYRPNWDHSRVAETIWWGLPALIIIFLSVVIWTSSHELDPYKPLSSSKPPLTVQVISLEWKWLFIYPEQKVASVNIVEFPENTPINFVLTGDSPMNSFWIPQLAGQIYSMNGMSTKLHLMANRTGDFRGSSANLSGEGFAGMKFIARSTSEKDFNSWVKKAQLAQPLDWNKYQELAKPSKDQPQSTYVLKDVDLYDRVIGKYMTEHAATKMKQGHGN